jgi:hypothetical protein
MKAVFVVLLLTLGAPVILHARTQGQADLQSATPAPLTSGWPEVNLPGRTCTDPLPGAETAPSRNWPRPLMGSKKPAPVGPNCDHEAPHAPGPAVHPTPAKPASTRS